MSAAIALTPATHTLAEYLALEAEAYRTGSDAKYEYIAGEVYAMAGAQPAHNDIVLNAVLSMGPALRTRGCKVSIADQRVAFGEAYVYPDLVVTCEARRFRSDSPPTLLNPLLIVEVLSESTAERDLGTKLAEYFRIESLREYWVVATDRPLVWQYARREAGWLLTTSDGIDATLRSEDLDLTLPLAEVYDGLFEDAAPEPPGGDGEAS